MGNGHSNPNHGEGRIGQVSPRSVYQANREHDVRNPDDTLGPTHGVSDHKPTSRLMNTAELMDVLETRCQQVVKTITDVRKKGPVDDDTSRYFNRLLRSTEEELHRYNATMMNMSGDSQSAESDASMIRGLDSLLKKGVLHRKPNVKEIEEAKHLHNQVEALSNENVDLTKTLDQQTEQLRKLEKDHQDLLLRFSKLAGVQLSENNPSIADLSDPDRPTKIGEAFKELYDNEWTDAYEQLLEDGRSEIQAIELLLKTLQETHGQGFFDRRTCQYSPTSTKNVADFCKKTAQSFLEEIEKVIEHIFEPETPTDGSAALKGNVTIGARQGTTHTKNAKHDMTMQDMRLYSAWERSRSMGDTPAGNSPGDTLRLTTQRRSKLTPKMTTIRKDIAVFLVPLMQKAYLSPSRWTKQGLPMLKPFIKKCLRISWLMVVQKPPMCFLGSKDPTRRSVKEVYTPYTRTGPVLDYVVWPALLLREDGEMVVKGIAQFKE